MRTQTDVKQLVGRIDDEYYVCDYLFRNGEDFKGAVATVLIPVSKAEYEQQTDPENVTELFEENWRMAVEAGATTQSLKDYAEQVLAFDGDEAVFDFSGYEYWDLIREAEPELTEEDYPVFQCSGGGRSFSPEMKFDKVYNKKLWQQIREIES